MNPTAELLQTMVQQGRAGSLPQCQHYFDRFFGNLRLEGKSVLEIGSGRGELCLYAGCQGARRVVGLEPEGSGSSREVRQEFERMIDRLGLSQVVAIPQALQEYDAKGEKFDLVLSYSSINHLDETACRALQSDAEARETYRGLFRKINSLMVSGGLLLITDASRYNLFATLGVRNPLDPSIQWELHQSPRFWARLLRECGFDQPSVSWFQPRIMDRWGRLANNTAVAYLLRSRFRMALTKVEDRY